MMGQNAFNDALDASIDALRQGEQVDAILSRYPHHADELRPLLETAALANPSLVYEAPTARLHDNFGVVQAALRRSQMAIVREAQPAPRIRTGWWNKRLFFASMSLPAGVFAFALLGASGAAAATTVALTTGIEEEIGSAVTSVVPTWAQPLALGNDDSSGGTKDITGEVDTSRTVAAALNATPTPSTQRAGDNTTQPAATSVTAPSGTRPIRLLGVVSNIRGNTFELVVDGEVFKVQTDVKTTFIGEFVTGATAEVSGTSGGDGNVRATLVEVTGASQEAEPPQSPVQPPATSPAGPPSTPPGRGENTKTPPGQTEETKTPPVQHQATKTPPGQAEKTKTPGPPATPPSQGGGKWERERREQQLQQLMEAGYVGHGALSDH